MAERRTLLSQVSKSTQPLQHSSINAQQGAFGDYSGHVSFGSDLAQVGGAALNYLDQENKETVQRYKELKAKADAIADQNIAAQFRRAVAEANVKIAKNVMDADAKARDEGRYIVGDERNELLAGQQATFNKTIEEVTDVVKNQYSERYSALVTPEVIGAAWAGSIDNHMMEGFKYSATVMSALNADNQMKDITSIMDSAAFAPGQTIKHATGLIANIKNNLTLDDRQRMAMTEIVKKKAAGNMHSQIEDPNFPDFLEDAFRKNKVLSPTDYAELKNKRFVYEHSGQAKTRGQQDALNDMNDQIANNVLLPPDKVEETYAAAIAAQPSVAAANSNVVIPSIMARYRANLSKTVATGVIDGNASTSPEYLTAQLLKGPQNPDAKRLVYSSLLPAEEATLSSSPSLTAISKDTNGVMAIGAKEYMEAYTLLLERAKWAAEKLKNRHGAEVFQYATDVQEARAKGFAEYKETLSKHYDRVGKDDPMDRDYSDPQEITDLGFYASSAVTPNNVEMLNRKTDAYLAKIGPNGGDSIIGIAATGDDALHGYLSFRGQFARNGSSNNPAVAKQLNREMAAAVVYTSGEEFAKIRSEHKDEIALIDNMVEHSLAITYADQAQYDLKILDDPSDEAYRKAFAGPSFLGASAIGQIWKADGTYQSSLAMVKAYVYTQIYANSSQGKADIPHHTIVNAVNQGRNLVSFHINPMKTTGSKGKWSNYANVPFRSLQQNSFMYADSRRQLGNHDVNNSEHYTDSLEGFMLALIPKGGEGISLGFKVQHNWAEAKATLLSGSLMGSYAIFNAAPSTATRYFSAAVASTDAGMNPFQIEDMDISKAVVKDRLGRAVPLERTKFSPQTFDSELSAWWDGYFDPRDPRTGTTLVVLNNYEIKINYDERRVYFYIRPANINVNDTVRFKSHGSSIPLYVPDGKFEDDGVTPTYKPLSISLENWDTGAAQVKDKAQYQDLIGETKHIPSNRRDPVNPSTFMP